MRTRRTRRTRGAAVAALVALLLSGCAGGAEDATGDGGAAPGPAEEPSDDPGTDATPADPSPDASPPAPTPVDGVSTTIACRRGTSLAELGLDVANIPFVPDDAPDDTTWVEIVVTVENPNDQRAQVDPGFEITFTDEAGAEIVTQPFYAPGSPYYRDVGLGDHSVGAGQTVVNRLVVFEGYSGTLYLRQAHADLLERLAGCELAGDVVATAADEPVVPDDLEVTFSGCALDEGAHFVGTVELANSSTAFRTVALSYELLDADGTRVGRMATYDVPIAVGASDTAVRELETWAWQLADPGVVVGCELHVFEVG